MGMLSAMKHDGGPYPADMLEALRAMAVRDGLPPTADLATLAEKVRGTKPGRFSPNGSVFSDGTHYFKGRWTYVGSDEDGQYATEVPFCGPVARKEET